MTEPDPRPRLRIRVLFREGEMLGPGKAELLARIARTGSIAAAGREMSMSYKRAWLLVETMNIMFREPLVTSSRGGKRGGGAILTEAGRAALAEYHAVVAAAEDAARVPMSRLAGMLKDMSD